MARLARFAHFAPRRPVSPRDRRQPRETLAITAALLAAAVSPALADDHCELVEATADAEAATAAAPSVFARAGYVDRTDDTTVLDLGAAAASTASGRYATAGVAFHIDGLFEARARRAAARAECTRHLAELAIAALPRLRELEARGQVLADARTEASALAAEVAREVAEHVIPAADLVAIQLRVDRLERQYADVRQELASIPAAARELQAVTLATARNAELAAEDSARAVRTYNAVDVQLRAGYQRYFDETATDRTPWFGTISVDINLGVFARGSANARARRALDRAAAERERVHGAQLADDTSRSSSAAARLIEVGAQLDLLDRLGGLEGRRQRRLLWFDLVELRADHAGATARLVVRRAQGGAR